MKKPKELTAKEVEMIKEGAEGIIHFYNINEYQFEEVQIEEKESENHWEYLEEAIRFADMWAPSEEEGQPQIIREVEFEEMKEKKG